MKKRKTIHGIDLTAPGGVHALLDFHRATFGDAQMNAGGEGGAGNGEGGQGGDPGAGEGGGGAGQSQTQTPAPAGQQSTPPAGTASKTDDGNGENPWDDPVKAKAEIERLQQEAASAGGKARDNARQQAAQQATDELTQKLGKALGLIKDGEEKPDAEKLTQQLTEQANAAKAAQLELAVFKAAGKPDLGADAAALLDSRSFLAKIGDIDPTDAKAVEAAVKEAVDANPKLKASQVAAKGSAEIGGGSGEQRDKKPGSIMDAVGTHYSNH